MTPSDEKTPHIVPWWMWLIIILCALPGLTAPFYGTLTNSPDTMVKGLTWFFPLYTLVSAFLAWQCYGRRTLLSWIILALLVLSDLGFYWLGSLSTSPLLYR